MKGSFIFLVNVDIVDSNTWRQACSAIMNEPVGSSKTIHNIIATHKYLENWVNALKACVL